MLMHKHIPSNQPHIHADISTLSLLYKLCCSHVQHIMNTLLLSGNKSHCHLNVHNYKSVSSPWILPLWWSHLYNSNMNKLIYLLQNKLQYGMRAWAKWPVIQFSIYKADQCAVERSDADLMELMTTSGRIISAAVSSAAVFQQEETDICQHLNQRLIYQRLRCSAFVPTHNWLCVLDRIHID